MLERAVTSLRELEDGVEAWCSKETLCFRGQSSADWDLVPSAYRALVPLSQTPGFDPSFSAEIERDTYREFEIQARLQLTGSRDVLERLSIAQHHGVPTRLLDWTLDLTIGAYFAVFGGEKGDAAVWALSLSNYPFPAALGRQHLGQGFPLEKIRAYGSGVVESFTQPVSKPINSVGSSPPPPPDGTFVVWKPTRVADRLARQKGLLSWYHSFDDSDLVWNYSAHIRQIEVQCGKNLLAKFVIPLDKREKLQHEILDRNISEHDLFADLDGLGKQLTRQHRNSMVEAATP
jgi:FRG domain